MKQTTTERGNIILDPRTLAITMFEPRPTGVYEERIYSEVLAEIKPIQDRYMWAKEKTFEEFFEIFRADGGFQDIVIDAKDIISAYNDEELKKVKKACSRMVKMTSNIIEDINNIIFVPVWSYIKYAKGQIKCRPNDAMAFHLLHMEHGWTKRQLDVSLNLKRPRQQTLYRVLHSMKFDAQNHHGFVFLSKEQLIQILYPTSNQIKHWGLFTTFVLNPTLQKIREKTDLKNIDYTYRTGGRGGQILGADFNYHFDPNVYDISSEGKIKAKYKYSREVLQREANECWEFLRTHQKPCRPRNCHRCQFCYELGRNGAYEPKPFGWVLNGSGGIVEKGSKKAMQQTLFDDEKTDKTPAKTVQKRRPGDPQKFSDVIKSLKPAK